MLILRVALRDVPDVCVLHMTDNSVFFSDKGNIVIEHIYC